ncbi:MAG: amidohydrolase [Nanoarchaeota archaeon]|nr:amidohydrolase [Nanoarchaeota archaeon]
MVNSESNQGSRPSNHGLPGIILAENEKYSIPLPAVNDVEGERVPAGFPFIVDAHVHLFPDMLFESVWEWFDKFGWPVRYKLKTPEILSFLLSKGINRIVALHYAHKPGIAEKLNRYMAEVCRLCTAVTGLATVFPGEAGAVDILSKAFSLGLSGVKLHSHVQCFDMEGRGMQEVYETCVRYDKPLIMHVGREPRSPEYPCDPYLLCSFDRLERVIKAYPSLKVCVPHLGADEFEEYGRMIKEYDNLWLDTTMALADYLPFKNIPKLSGMRADRIIFGTDFPNIPYAWDREIKRLLKMDLPCESLEKILGGNAAAFYSL